MIKGTFEKFGEPINVIVDGNNMFFHDINGMITTIEGLKLDKVGTLKEFPDLKDKEECKKIAI